MKKKIHASMLAARETIPHLLLKHTLWLQGRTQHLGNRPYGAGLLVAGLDESGTHLYYNCPSGNYFEVQAFAIGSHSEAAKTYLESKFENFMDSSREDLIKEALIATRETLQGKNLKSSICTVAVVGVEEPFHILDDETVQQLIDTFEIGGEEDPAAADAAEQGVGAELGAAPNQGVAPMHI